MLLLFYCGSVCKTSWIALNEIYWKKFPGASKSSEWITGNISLECFTHSTRIYFSKFNITLLYFLLSRQDRTGQDSISPFYAVTENVLTYIIIIYLTCYYSNLMNTVEKILLIQFFFGKIFCADLPPTLFTTCLSKYSCFSHVSCVS